MPIIIQSRNFVKLHKKQSPSPVFCLFCTKFDNFEYFSYYHKNEKVRLLSGLLIFGILGNLCKIYKLLINCKFLRGLARAREIIALLLFFTPRNAFIKGRIIAVEVLLVHFILCYAQCISKALIVNYLSCAKELNWVANIGVINEP